MRVARYGRGLLGLAQLAVTLHLAPRAARAQESALASANAPPPVLLVESSCSAAPREEVLAALRVELREQLVESDAAVGAYRVFVGCSDDVLRVEVVSPDAERTSFETALRGTAAGVRPRLVALTVAEIARDLPPLVPAEPPIPAPEPPLQKAPAVAKPVEPHVPGSAKHPYELALFGQLSRFDGNGTWLSGGGLTFGHGAGALKLAVDLVLLYARDEFALGRTSALAIYAQPSAAYRHVWGWLEGRAGAAFAVGLSRLEGRAEKPSDRDGTLRVALLAPSLFTALGVRAAPRVLVLLKLSAGVMLVPAVGQVLGGKDVQLRGLWTSLSLGAAYEFGG